MKCVCPMGGDRTCPDNCPLAVWAAMPESDRKTKRKPVAEQLYKQGFTMEAIATQLGVSVQTVSTDLRQFSSHLKIKPSKTASNPKGAGRPKGSKRPRDRAVAVRKKGSEATEALAATMVIDQGLTLEEAANETGIGSAQKVKVAVAHERGRRAAVAEPEITRDELAMSAAERLDAAIRQHKRKLDMEFETRVRDEVRKRIDEIVLPHWKQQIEEARKIYEKRKGITDKATFNLIWSALHPDSRKSISDRKLATAFDAFSRLEKYMLNEKDSPTVLGDLPDNLAEWDKMRAKHRAGRNSSKMMARR